MRREMSQGWDEKAFQKAATCLEHANHDVRRQAPEWPERAEATIEEGLRVLEQGV